MISEAIAFQKKFSLAEGNQFEQYQILMPKLNERDLLVKTVAISITQIDTVLREKIKGPNRPYVLGFGGVGVITRKGSEDIPFSIGDRILYVNKVGKYGSYSDFQVIDSRSAVKLPEDFSSEDGAAFSYCFLLAYHALFDKFNLISEKNKNQGKMLIVNSSGGVGSIAIQLAKWAGLEVIAAINESNSKIWIEKMGAKIVINQQNNLSSELRKVEVDHVDYALHINTDNNKIKQTFDFMGDKGDLVAVTVTKDKKNPKPDAQLKVINAEEYFDESAKEVEKISENQKHLQFLLDLWAQEEIQSIITAQVSEFTPKVIFGAHKLIETNPNFRHIVVSNK